MKLYNFLFGDKEISIYEELTYRRISYSLSLIVAFILLVPSNNSTLQFVKDLLIMIMIAFSVLGTRNKYALISFILYGLNFNIALINYLRVDVSLSNYAMHLIKLIILIPGSVLWLIALWQNYKNKEILKLTKHKILYTFIVFVIFSLIFIIKLICS